MIKTSIISRKQMVLILSFLSSLSEDTMCDNIISQYLVTGVSVSAYVEMFEQCFPHIDPN